MGSGSDTEDFEDLFGSEPVAPSKPMERYIEYVRIKTKDTMQLRVMDLTFGQAHHLWNGARWMGDYIDEHPSEFVDKKILEIGAGAGLPSLLATKAGASKVVVTDYPDLELIENIQKNIDTLLTRDGMKRIEAKGFLWGSETESLGQFDIILMCDIIFNHSEHKKIIKTIKDCLRDGGLVWCVFSHYRPWYKERDLELLSMVKSDLGLRVEFIDQVAYDEVMVPDNRADRDSLRTVYAYKFFH